VVCLDDSRVKLRSLTDEFLLDSDYIHANYVDGYKQKNAYISTQGPLEDTIEDFWLMIWQESVNVIVMTTKVRESKAIKCSQYWPLEQNERFTIANFDIQTLSVEQQPSYTISKLQLKNVNTGQSRDIVHAQFTAWPDHGCPKSPTEMIEFVQVVRKHQRLLNEKNTSWNGHPLGAPIVVHCSAGIGRTGTFCTIDIALNRIKDNNRVNIADILHKIRTQRAQSVQTPEQYLYCYMAILQYALDNQLLDSAAFNLMQLFSK
jgi:tyrosine-protein phosphatase non-receptor type 9